MTWDLPAPRFGRARIRVLCVDDEPVILQIVRRLLETQSIEAETRGDPREAVASFQPGLYDLVITDIHMPVMDGLALMRALREREPELPVVVVTGQGTVETAIKALREGATGMVVKPFTGEELLSEVRRALVSAQMRYEALQYRYLSPVLDSVALTLSSAIEARNLETGEHCRQLGVLSERMAAVIGLNERQRTTIRIGGYLHDIGKIGIADAILLKPEKLTEEETAEMRRHCEIGAAILEVHDAMLGIGEIVRHHHERWDGRGYPTGLARDEIPLGARIIAVADAFSAMTTDRIYRPAMPVDQAWLELRTHAGGQFDPAIVDVFAQVVDEEGELRPLDADLESSLPEEPSTNGNDELHARLAMLPVLEPYSARPDGGAASRSETSRADQAPARPADGPLTDGQASPERRDEGGAQSSRVA